MLAPSRRADEHVTLKTVRAVETPANASRAYTCLQHGGFAIGSAAARLGEEAATRIRSLFEPPFLCEGLNLCVHPPHDAAGAPRGYYLGSVSPEALSCDHSPAPLYCTLPSDRKFSNWRSAWHHAEDGGFLSRTDPRWVKTPFCEPETGFFTLRHCGFGKYATPHTCSKICVGCKRLYKAYGALPNFGRGVLVDPRESGAA